MKFKNLTEWKIEIQRNKNVKYDGIEMQNLAE